MRRLTPGLTGVLWLAPLIALAFLVGCEPETGRPDEVVSDTVIEGEIITDADTVEESELVSFTTPENVTPRATVDGFRVQLFAGSNEANARQLAREAESLLGVPVYVSFIDGYWKVRAGDCRTRAEAETLRNRARNAGYSDAWIAADKVVQ
ncbi:MAG TPA: SPOR domain-containing protein [Candidatus Coatesbacteria bacterium]|nr:SPOR domain-containing protein [Candidatus Coatesbacteria bacterium]